LFHVVKLCGRSKWLEASASKHRIAGQSLPKTLEVHLPETDVGVSGNTGSGSIPVPSHSGAALRKTKTAPYMQNTFCSSTSTSLAARSSWRMLNCGTWPHLNCRKVWRHATSYQIRTCSPPISRRLLETAAPGFHGRESQLGTYRSIACSVSIGIRTRTCTCRSEESSDRRLAANNGQQSTIPRAGRAGSQRLSMMRLD
jgi:hypothetical protein